MLKYFLLVFIFIGTLGADDFANYLKNKSNLALKENQHTNISPTVYEKAFTEAMEEYRQNIKKNFSKIDITKNSKWVQYSNSYKEKKIIDFSKNTMLFEVIAFSEKDAQNKILKLYDKLYNYDVRKAYSNDFLERKITKKLNKVLELPIEKQNLISSIITKERYKSIRKRLLLKSFKKEKYNDKLIYTVKIKLPSFFNRKKARLYKNIILEQSEKLEIEASLIYAIIDIKSGFNPLSRSRQMGVGLMHVTPYKIGKIAYKYLTGYSKVLSSDYLLNTKNNITLGSTYLKILFKEDFVEINNFKSRWYCTIVAYDIGTKNLSKAFVKSENMKDAIKVINNMSSDQVYKRLMKKLPRGDTKRYFYKVNQQIKEYVRLLRTNKI